MTIQEFIDATRHGLIVSCQAQPGEPLYVEEKSVMYLMARAAKMAGACGIRTESVRDVIAIKKETGLPVIGLIKIKYEGYESYITPTMREVDALVKAGADVVAADCTLRTRGDGLTAGEYIKSIKEKYPGVILMADISTAAEAQNAYKCGADIVGTTMSGYTQQSRCLDDPDFELMSEIAAMGIPFIAEGRIHYPEQAKQALELGANAVVVGGAITRPLEIADRFVKKINEIN